MEEINKIIITTIESFIKKYLKSVSYDREGIIKSIEPDGRLCIIIDSHEYRIRNGTGINFSPGDKCLIHYINGEENGKIVIAKLFDENRKVTKDQLAISDVAFTGSYTDLTDRPSAMKNPYAYTSNGKTYDGSVLDARQGKALKDGIDTLTAKVNDCFQSASNGKSLIAAAISGKGVSTAANASFQEMADHIGQIETSSNGAINFTCSGGDSHAKHHGSFKVYDAKKIIVNSVSARNDMKQEVRWSSNFGFNYSDSSGNINASFGAEYITSGINPVIININGNCGNDSSISIHAYY